MLCAKNESEMGVDKLQRVRHNRDGDELWQQASRQKLIDKKCSLHYSDPSFDGFSEMRRLCFQMNDLKM